jgi:putative acetyltransferase
MGAWEHPVIVGRAERADAEAILSTVTDPKAIAGTLQVPYPSVEMWRKRVAELPPDNYFLAATVAGEVVGSRGLHRAAKSPRRRHAGNLGVTVRDDRHGRGVDTASTNAAIELADGWRNLAGIALHRRLGFTMERTCRGSAFVTGVRRVYDLEAASRACDQTMGVACGQPMKEAAR